MQVISAKTVAAPSGHYVHAMVHGDLIYVSGQLPNSLDGVDFASAPVEAQAEQAIRNVEEILRAAGSSLDQVIKATVYISDIELWGRVNAVFARLFGDHRPARVVVPTTKLYNNYLVEVDVVAARLSTQAPIQ